MNFEADALGRLAQAAQQLAPAAGAPRVRALHLPPHRPEDPLSGESCALELDDGSIGLSYVLFGDALDRLHAGAQALVGSEPLALAAGLRAPVESQRGIDRTLGLAAANALTAWIFRRVGYAPPPAPDSIASIDPRAGERIGMIGFFAPLLPAIAAAGASLVVVELRADLIGERDGITVTADPAALAGCDKVVATGTVLLNGTLERMRAAAHRARRFALIGPSAGLLPDALFAAGVTDIGGSWIEDGPAFVEALRRGERRGRAARKFTLGAADYPGLPALLSRPASRTGSPFG
jgi:uncharacterized protein (DUF4213/DUF364 family)